MSKIRASIVAIVLSSSFGSAFAGDLPNRSLTPGVTNGDIRQDNIDQTVCVRGFTKTIRPPQYYTNSLKKEQMQRYGYMDRNPQHYEEDHLIPLSIGGHPTDPRNLWPQPRETQWGADQKDALEFVLFRMVCTHEISLFQAQQEIGIDWISAYKKYVPTHPQFKYGSGE